MYRARELELEDRQSRLEIQLRERIPNAGLSALASSVLKRQTINVSSVFESCLRITDGCICMYEYA